jgi:dinuclear metal center YbgI/SA1388 family protein
MPDLHEIISRIDTLLRPEEFDDYCVNGLQIEGSSTIQHLAVGVSVSQRFIEAALERGADALLVHHGLFWKQGTPHPMQLRAGPLRDRLKLILENDLSLIAYHLPLDAHPEVGNNACIARELGLLNTETVSLGVVGNTPSPEPALEFVRRLGEIVGQEIDPFLFGPEEVNRVGVISGGAGGMYPEILAAGCDTFITGDRNEHLVREFEEVGLNHLFAGHYATERFGPRALGEWCGEELGVEWEFIDVANRV